jgi:aminoglycoside-2''-adenylyltransferase
MDHELDQVRPFYCRALGALRDSGIPFLIGGAYALGVHTGIHRETKDLDIFTVPRAASKILELFSDLGYASKLVARHWLGKVMWQDAVIDIIFGFRNGVSQVADGWFDHARDASLFEMPVRVLAAEEMIWSKAFVMERERYDGADIVHLIRGRTDMDWRRLLDLFGSYWPLLLNYLVLFGFVYPAERSKIPDWLVRELTERWRRPDPGANSDLCQGTLLSHLQYVHDIRIFGLADARLLPIGNLTEQGINE